MSKGKNLLFELLVDQVNFDAHRLSHNNPLNHPNCRFCKTWISAAQYDHNREAVGGRIE